MRLEKLPELKSEHKVKIRELIKERKEELLEFAEDIYTEYAYYALIDGFQLDDREAAVLRCKFREGLNESEIAGQLSITQTEVEQCENNLCTKMCVETLKDVDIIISNYYLAIMVKISNYFFELLDENI